MPIGQFGLQMFPSIRGKTTAAEARQLYVTTEHSGWKKKRKKSIKVIPKLDHKKIIGDQVFQNYVQPEE